MWRIIEYNYQLFLQGLLVTLLLAVVGTVGGFFLSLLFVAARTSKVDKKRDPLIVKIMKKISSWFVLFYVTIFRGTPMILQAMVFFYGLLLAGIQIQPLQAGLLVVTLNTTAYIIEILRGAVNGIDKGQMEAARSLGFSRFKALMLFVYPQAIKNAIPAIVSEFIVNLKDTAVLSVIGVMDLFRQLELIFMTPGGNAALDLNVFVIGGLMYLFITTVTTVIALLVERGMNKEVRLNA